MGVYICIYIYISGAAFRKKSRLFVNKWVENIERIQKNYKKSHIEKLSGQKDEYILCIYLSIDISNCVYNTQNCTTF